jgi:hypothetical protein
MRIARIAIVVCAFLAAGCSGRQQHIVRDYGQSYDRAFAAQHVRGPRPPATAVVGLDAQEAAIISETYRRDLAPKGAKVEEQPMVITVPPTRDNMQQQLPPSVPKG